MPEHVPTTAQVRRQYTSGLAWPRPRITGKWFDAWLARDRRQVAEQTARAIADGFDDAGAASWIGQRIRNAADTYASTPAPSTREICGATIGDLVCTRKPHKGDHLGRVR